MGARRGDQAVKAVLALRVAPDLGRVATRATVRVGARVADKGRAGVQAPHEPSQQAGPSLIL